MTKYRTWKTKICLGLERKSLRRHIISHRKDIRSWKISLKKNKLKFINCWKNHHQWSSLPKVRWDKLKKDLVLNQYTYLKSFKMMMMAELYFSGQDWRLNFNLTFLIRRTNFTDFLLKVQFHQSIIIQIIWVWGKSQIQSQVKELMKWWELRRKILKISQMTHMINKMKNNMKMMIEFFILFLLRNFLI